MDRLLPSQADASTLARKAAFRSRRCRSCASDWRPSSKRVSVRMVVASAACGSDLIALDVAGELGLERRVILPFEPNRFAETSVEDRPGEWRTLYGVKRHPELPPLRH
jgi:hypothetical protein